MKKKAKDSMRLPTRFKERVASLEVVHEKGTIDSKSLQELITLYTIGKEYYGLMKNKTLQWFYRDRLIKLQNYENKKKFLSQESEGSAGIADTRISTGQNNKPMLKLNVCDESFLFPKIRNNMNKRLSYGGNNLIITNLNTTRIVSDKKSLFKQNLNETFNMGCISEKGVSMYKSHKSKNNLLSSINVQDFSSPAKSKFITPMTDRTMNVISNTSSSLFKTLNLDDKLNKSIRLQKSSDNIQKKQVENQVKDAFLKFEEGTKSAKLEASKQVEVQIKQFEEKKKRKLSCEKFQKSKKYLKRKGAQFNIMKNYFSEGADNSQVITNMLNFIEEKVTEDTLWQEIEKIIRSNEDLKNIEIEHIKQNFKDDINEMEDVSMYEDVIKGLQDDMEKEIKKVKSKYEEKKQKEIEEIKSRFKNY